MLRSSNDKEREEKKKKKGNTNFLYEGDSKITPGKPCPLVLREGP